MDRYAEMFARVKAANAGVFVPFAVLGDPSPESSLTIVEALINGGADALELGVPFSDPVADGPVIQAAATRAIAARTTPEVCMELLKKIRARYPNIPIGLLVYSNLVVHAGPKEFFDRLAGAGVDSVLIADIPSVELTPYAELALAAGVAPIFVVPPNATDACLKQVAKLGRGYTYLLGRAGVTGTQTAMQRPAKQLVDALQEVAAPPALLGFGISTPEHVRSAIEAGARGAICGSAIVQIIAENLADEKARSAALTQFVARLKAATHGCGQTGSQ
jgi:tryptophan synthase alpha chain